MQEQGTESSVSFPAECQLCQSWLKKDVMGSSALSRFDSGPELLFWFIPALGIGTKYSGPHWSIFWYMCKLAKANSGTYTSYKWDFKVESPKLVFTVCIKDSVVRHWGGWKVIWFCVCPRNNVILLCECTGSCAVCLARTPAGMRVLLFCAGFVWRVGWKQQATTGIKY